LKYFVLEFSDKAQMVFESGPRKKALRNFHGEALSSKSFLALFICILLVSV